MPNRILRDGILSSERVDSLSSWAAECFYRRLHSIVDDFGRYYGNPSLIRAAAYPLKLDKVSNADVDKWLADCAGAGLVSTYESEGKRYLQLQDFRQHQRAAASKFPQPPGKCSADAVQMQRTRDAPAPVVVVEGVVYLSKSKDKPLAPDATRRGLKVNGHRIEFDPVKGAFSGITEDQELAWQDAYPAVPIPPAIGRAAAWAKANPANRKSNWERFLVNWFVREQDKAARVRR